MNEKFKYCTRRSRVQHEEFRVKSTASKCIYLPLNHELEVSNPFNILQYKFCALLGTGGGGYSLIWAI